MLIFKDSINKLHNLLKSCHTASTDPQYPCGKEVCLIVLNVCLQFLQILSKRKKEALLVNNT